MKVALLGSTGYVGGEILKSCIEQGHQIKVLVRSPEKLGQYAKMVEVVEGDYCDPKKVTQTVAGTEIVLSAIGPMTKKPEDVPQYTHSMTDAMKNLVAIIEKEKIKKVIWISGAATPVNKREKFNMKQNFIKFMLNATAKHILAIKTMESSILANSNLDWIIVRPPAILKGDPANHVVADDQKLHGMRIDRADLVDFIMQQITSDKWLHKAPLVCSIKK